MEVTRVLREAGLIAALLVAACGEAPLRSESVTRTEPAPDSAPPPQSPAPEVLGEGCLLVEEEGRPLAGWTIEADVERPARSGGTRTERVLAMTNSSGRFPRLGKSIATDVVAWAPGSDGTVRRRLDPKRVDFSATGIRLRLARSNEITGYVESWRPWALATARVTAVRHRNGQAESCPARNGCRVSVRDLEPGDTVDVTAESPGHHSLTLRQLVPGSIVTLRLVQRIGAIEGVVTDLQGRPIALAWVRFRPRAGGIVEQTLCDLDGRFSAIRTLEMDYDVTVLVPHPTKSYEPGIPAGQLRGGARGVVLRVPRER